jgi:hypothetical protein
MIEERVNGEKSLTDAERRLKKYVLTFFGDCRAHTINADGVQSFILHRQEAGASNAEINLVGRA